MIQSLLSVQKSASGSRTVPAGMARKPIRAVTIDALGTLLELLPPAPRLRAGLRERSGVEVSDDEAARAMRAEIGFYRAHLRSGRDAGRARRAAPRAARRCCATRSAAPSSTSDALTEALLEAIRFEPFPDAVPALRALRAAGMRLVAASNWDVSLHEQLERTGLAPLLDGAVSSAEVGARQAGPGDLRARARARGRDAGGGAARRRRRRGRRGRRARRPGCGRC